MKFHRYFTQKAATISVPIFYDHQIANLLIGVIKWSAINGVYTMYMYCTDILHVTENQKSFQRISLSLAPQFKWPDNTFKKLDGFAICGLSIKKLLD
jgi:hypothetical protein